MKKNEIFECVCEEVSDEGYGIVKPEGFVLFVRGLWRGDTARIIVTKLEKRYGYGRILEILVPSPVRTENTCPSYPRCGGCGLRHITYEEECAWKEEKVRRALSKIPGWDAEFYPIVPSPAEDGYRNKLQAPLAYRDGILSWGFYRVHSHDLIPMKECLIENENAVRLINELTQKLSDEAIAPYLRHILIRHGEKSGEYMIVIVARRKELPGLSQIAEEFRLNHPEVVSVILNINGDETNVILGKEDVLLSGRESIRDTLGELQFEISAHSFYQVNPRQCVNLYNEAGKFAGLTRKDTVLDLYCGTGTIALWMADKAGEVLGIEIVPSAIENARKNASRNRISNASFLCEDAGKGAEILRKEKKHADVIIVDPPRKGMDETARKVCVKFDPERIVYVSCNPVTLARDLAWFEENGYHVKKARPFDMFPRTFHVESVVLMSRTDL